MPDNFHPNFTATGIGSLPHLDAVKAVDDVLSRLGDMPYWPQLGNRSPWEDMNLMFCPALKPLIGADEAERSMLAHPGVSREEALAGFYERLFSGELDSFKLNNDIAAGFFEFISRVQAAPEGSYPWLKGHVTGPVSLASCVMGKDGKTLLFDDEAAEAIARGLGVAAAAQAGQLAELGRPMMIFIDEPSLSGYGSAFTPISREQVLTLLGATLEELTSRIDVVTGIHCCGNTDWGLLIEAGFDVINLDSQGFGEHLLLYPNALKDLFARNGAVAWGAVPTVEYKGDETAEELWAGLKGILQQLEAKGIDRATLANQALVTPACGLGGLDEPRAAAILQLTAQVSELAKAEYR